jgi:hypothetical protein
MHGRAVSQLQTSNQFASYTPSRDFRHFLPPRPLRTRMFAILLLPASELALSGLPGAQAPLWSLLPQSPAVRASALAVMSRSLRCRATTNPRWRPRCRRKSPPQKPPSSIIDSHGPFSNPTPTVRHCPRERFVMPHARRLRNPLGRLGGWTPDVQREHLPNRSICIVRRDRKVLKAP